MTAIPRHADRVVEHVVLRRIGMVLTAVLAFGAAGGAAAYLDLQSQMEVTDVDALIGRDRVQPPPIAVAEPDPTDPFAGQARNILVMGTDYRDSDNAALAGAGDEFNSDTTFVVHISGDRSRIEIVSIPRDSLVAIPACPLPGGGYTAPRSLAMFNSAFAIGGGPTQDFTGAAACTILTVEALTGLSIHDHVILKMNGVVDIVDAIGGVPMCLPEPVSGQRVDLDLEAGEHRFDGRTSIEWLRVRKGRGMGLEMGSDLARIERQQAFVDAMLREILDQNVVTDSRQLYRMVQASLRAMSTSPDLGSPAALAGLAWSLKDVDVHEIEIITVPVMDSPRNPNRVEWTWEANEIWERLAADVPLKDEPEPEATLVGSDTSGSASGADGAGADGPDADDDTSGADVDEAGTASTPTPSPSPSVRDGVCA